VVVVVVVVGCSVVVVVVAGSVVAVSVVGVVVVGAASALSDGAVVAEDRPDPEADEARAAVVGVETEGAVAVGLVALPPPALLPHAAKRPAKATSAAPAKTRSRRRASLRLFLSFSMVTSPSPLGLWMRSFRTRWQSAYPTTNVRRIRHPRRMKDRLRRSYAEGSEKELTLPPTRDLEASDGQSASRERVHTCTSSK